MFVLADTAIASGALPAAEGIIQSLVADAEEPTAVRIRGHVLVTGNATAGTITIRIRQGSVTGTQVYTSGALSAAASAVLSIPFDVKDTSNYAATGGTYELTAVDSAGAGTVNGGYLAVEVIP